MNSHRWQQTLRVSGRSLLLTLIVGLAGCIAAPDEDDHADHEIPAHKPEHFVEAVAQIAARTDTDQLTAEGQQELSDILGWLPELAAQTDLPKADWDTVHQLSGELAAAAPPGPDLLARARDALPTLQPLAQKAIELDTFNTYNQETQP